MVSVLSMLARTFLKERNGWFVPNFSGELKISCECGLANFRLCLSIIPDRLADVDQGPYQKMASGWVGVFF